MLSQRRLTSQHIVAFLLLLVASIRICLRTHQHAMVHAFSKSLPLPLQSRQSLIMRYNMDPSLHVEEEIDAPKKQFMDKNGQEFVQGQTVQVSREGLKAYQVPAKGKGSFEGTTFVPDSTLPYLLVPVGLRGVVTKVIDTHVLSANFPIRVKFEADKSDAMDNKDECCAPVSFVMHFGPQEVEIV